MNTATKEKINVTKSFMPPLEKYQEYIEKIYNNSWLTNQGPILQTLESIKT